MSSPSSLLERNFAKGSSRVFEIWLEEKMSVAIRRGNKEKQTPRTKKKTADDCTGRPVTNQSATSFRNPTLPYLRQQNARK